ncbi:hypothetical protein CANARDRAFT_18870 [[Candida] arabinofermentans NRRL YB-2248]|uniref:F-box domain-containing protein n=1 Tax=[Candida] arabinofermentans NRRL YB-2248 TaxID=983967 RepID=A0A1E4SWW1_9ASCO|nr:hypothetical protein CANARDRAFT_18870 [[Candida] arabinofermentans NRRL YB-2248]
MLFESFNLLPIEIKLQIIHQASPNSLLNLLYVNKEVRNLVIYDSNRRVCTYLGIENNLNNETNESQNLLISIYSPQNAAKRVELYDTKCLNTNVTNSESHSPKLLDSKSSLDIDEVIHKLNLLNGSSDDLELNKSNANVYHTSKGYKEQDNSSSCISDGTTECIIKLGNIQKIRDPLKTISDVNNLPILQDYSSNDNNNLHVIVDDDNNSFKLQFEMHLKTNSEKTVKLLTCCERIDLNETSNCINLITAKGATTISYNIIKGDQVPPRGPYDYESFTNYNVQVESFSINNIYLLNCIHEALKLNTSL